MELRSLIHSPLNYTGGKFKILKDIVPLFPEGVETFVDLFAGGLNVGINVIAERVIANDQLSFLIGLYRFFQGTKWDDLKSRIHGRIAELELTQENEKGYLELRRQYNETHEPLDLFLLTCYAFNHQIRFNSKHEFNTSFGKDRSSYNKSIEANLAEFVRRLQTNNITLRSGDFLGVPVLELSERDLVYCDPPYLISTGSYNDGKRGFKDWTEKEEGELLGLLDAVNERGIKFALSNVFAHKGMQNEMLIEWARKYEVNYIDKKYSNCSYHFKDRGTETVEVLVTNYKPERGTRPTQMTLL